jgi:cytochrome P450
MASETLFRRITDYANRADPYPLYAELREHRVVRQDDGAYLVGSYDEIAALLHDPRISSDRHNHMQRGEGSFEAPGMPAPFISCDDPEHQRLRDMAMRPFGPPHCPGRIDGMHGEIATIAKELVDGLAGRQQIDLVEDFAYPLPVTVICRLLGVPREDEPRFHKWSAAIIAGLDPAHGNDEAERGKAQDARLEMGEYLAKLAEQYRGERSAGMLFDWINDPDPNGGFSRHELMSTAVLLLVAGHETTVNLIANGMLTLLRYRDAFESLRRDPHLAPVAVEELCGMNRRFKCSHNAPHWPTSSLPGSLSPGMHRSYWCSRPATVIRNTLTTPSGSIRPAATTGTSDLAAACTAALARRSRGSKRRSH